MAQGINIEDRSIFTDPVRMPSPSAESPLGSVLEKVGGQVADVGSTIYKTDQAAAIFRAKTDISSKLKAAQVKAAEAPDASTALKIYNEEAGKVRNDASKYGFDGYTNEHIALAFEHYNGQTKPEVEHDAFAKTINRAQADLKRDIGQNMLDAGNDPNLDKRDWKETTRNSLQIARDAGMITPVQQEEWQNQFDKSVDHSAALGIAYNNPDLGSTLLDNPKNFPSLNPTDRLQIKETAENHSYQLLRIAAAREAKDQAYAEKMLKMQQKALASDFYKHAFAHDDPDLEKKILAAQNDLGGEFKPLIDALKGGAFGDDRDTSLQLNSDLYSTSVSGSQVRGEVMDAYRNGKITEASMNALLGKTLDMETRGGKPKILAGVDIGRQWLTTVTLIDQQGVFSAFDQQKKVRAADAHASYEQWVRMNPTAAPDVALKMAKDLGQTYIRGVHLDSPGAQKRPVGIPWLTDEKGAPKFSEMAVENDKIQKTDPTRYAKNLEALGAQSRAWQERQAKEAASGTKQ